MRRPRPCLALPQIDQRPVVVRICDDSNTTKLGNSLAQQCQSLGARLNELLDNAGHVSCIASEREIGADTRKDNWNGRACVPGSLNGVRTERDDDRATELD